jgi:ligand-binding sensor domain-containing protein/AraC-like DNA-binding protein
MKRFLLKGMMATGLLFLAATGVEAQQLQATRHHYSVDDGMASNAITQLIQDDYGYIWIGTWNGLSRFDGYNFYNYKTGAASHIPNLHNRIWQMTIDNQQNLWMRMYDSRVFVLKRSIDRIVNPFADISGSEEYRTQRRIVSTSNGDVLVSIDGVGLYRIRTDQDKFDCQLITTADMNVTHMVEGYMNDIWVGTDKGIHRLDASNLTIERKGVFLDENITSLYSNGYNVYAGTKSGKIVTFSYGQEAEELASGFSAINTIFVDSHGIIWFSDDRIGVSRYNPTTKDEKHFMQVLKVPNYDGIGSTFNEVNGIMWIRMSHGGYGYYNRERDEVEYFHNDPSNPWNLSNTVNASIELPEGVVFESTSRRGLEKLELMKNDIVRKRLVENPSSDMDNEVRGIYFDKTTDRLYISNKSGTLFVIDKDGKRTTYNQTDDGKPFRRIYGINKDSKGNIWLSSKDNGVFKLKPVGNGFAITGMQHIEGDETSLSDNHAYYTVEDKQGNIWVATYGGGVNLLPNGSTTFLSSKKGIKNYPLNSYQKVRTIAVDQDDNVWAGTTDGIIILSYKDGKIDVQKLKNSQEKPDNILQSTDIVCIASDAKGNMWVGTNGGGIACTIGKDSEGCWLFENFNVHYKLPSEEIKGLTFDNKGNVWFATDNNICSFNADKRIFATYSSLEGVDETIISEASATTMSNGNILFGTVNGYYEVDQKKLVTSNASLLKLRITDFFLGNEIQSPRLTDYYDYYVPDAKSVKIPNDITRFGFRFAALNYQLQHRIHYQYMLEDYDEDWINADQTRMAKYADVPAGTYTFKVKAFVIDSPDKFDTKEIEVIVPAPFFMSQRSIWLYMVIGVIIIVLFMFWRQNRIKSRLKKAHQQAARQEMAKQRSEEDRKFMVILNEWMNDHYAERRIDANEILKMLNLSLADFEENIKRLTGLSPKEFIFDFRLTKSQQILEDTDDDIDDIAKRVGFRDGETFVRLFHEKFNMLPNEYRVTHRKVDTHSEAYEIIE